MEVDSEATGSEATGPGGANQDLDRGTGRLTKQPGWYALGTNPNEQSFWDGERWSGVRHWVAGAGWIDGNGASRPAGPQPTRAETRLSANPYSTPLAVRARTMPATFSLAVLLLIVSGVALMFGSVGSWVHVTGSVGVANFHLSINGTDPAISTLIGVNGYVTFIGGIVLVVFGGLALSSDEVVLIALTTIASLAVLVFAIYDMFRIVQKISQVQTAAGSSVSVGWGLICVLSAAVLAMIVALARLFQQR